MADMHITVRIRGQHTVPHQQQLFRHRRAALVAQLPGQLSLIHHPGAHQVSILAVGQDRQARRFHTHQRLAHDLRVHQRHAVVAQCGGAGGQQSLHIRDLLALHAAGHGGHRIKMHLGVLLRPAVQLRHPLGTVDHRQGIGHGQQRGHAAPGRRRRSGGDSFFFLKARLPHMGMHVHQARRHHQARRIDHLFGPFCRKVSAHGSNHAAVDQQITDLIPPAGRIDHAPAANPFFHVCFLRSAGKSIFFPLFYQGFKGLYKQ